MKIRKFQPDEEGIIYIPNCKQLLTMGLQENVVTIWGAIGQSGGINMTFVVREDGDDITEGDLKHYVNSFINSDVILHLFGEDPK